MFTHFQHINTPLLEKLGTSEDLALIECLFQCFLLSQGNPVVYKTGSMGSNQVVSLNQQNKNTHFKHTKKMPEDKANWSKLSETWIHCTGRKA